MLEKGPSRWRQADWTFVCVATLVASVLRFYALDRKPFWLDEGVSVAISRLDWYNFARLLWRREANMSLYYLLLRGWQHLGGSEFFLRSLSVLFAIMTVPATYWLAGRLFGRRVAVVATALFSINAYSIRYAQEARSYSLYVFLGTLSWIFFIEYVDHPSRHRRLAYIAFSALAVYAHLYFAFFIVAQWASLRLRERTTVPIDATSTFFCIGVATFPALSFAATTGVGPLRWVPTPNAFDVYGYYDHMAGNSGPWLVLACFAAIVLGTWSVRRSIVTRNTNWETWRYQLLLIWIFLPLTLIVLLSFVRPLFVPRYLIACQVAFLVLVARGVDCVPQAWLRVSAAVLLIILSARGTLSYYNRDFDLDREDYRAATVYLLDHATPGDAVVFDIAQGRMPYDFYRSHYRGSGTAPRIIYPSLGERLDYRDFMGRASPDAIRGSLDGSDRVWLVQKTNAGTFTQDRTAQQLIDMLSNQYPVTEDKTFPGIDVRLFARKSALDSGLPVK